MCSCCPIKPLSSLGQTLLPLSNNSDSSTSPSLGGNNDQRSSSVAELRRKAQEHSAALLQSLQHVANFQQHAAAAGFASGLNFPLLPPLTLQALQHSAAVRHNNNSKQESQIDVTSSASSPNNLSTSSKDGQN